MAMSDWDMLAFGSEAQPSVGVLKAFSGALCEIYKNWIYVSDERAWVDKGNFTKPVIMSIGHGIVDYGGMSLCAERCELQKAIFVYAYSKKFLKKGPAKIVRMAGIGCYGFDDPLPRILKYAGAAPLSEGDSHVFSGRNFDSKGKSIDGWIECLDICRKDGTRQSYEYPKRLQAKYVGVQKNTYKAFLAFLDGMVEHDFEAADWIKKVKKTKPLRFCQGDRMFGEVEATAVGQAGKPVLLKMLEKVEKVER